MKRERGEREDLLCGVNAVLEQLRADPSRIRRLWVTSEPGGARRTVVDEARRRGVAIQAADTRALDKLAGGVRHQGVVAEVEDFRYAEWDELMAASPSCVVALDEVTDPRNVGAIVRSVDAVGAGGVLIPSHRSAGVTAVTARASAGATARVPIVRAGNLAQALEQLKKTGFWVVGLDGDADAELFDFTFPDRSVLVLGSEGKGLRPIIRAACDHRVAIPMRGAVASLNVSVAGAVALYEWLRQRGR
ncbi:MAG: 23S rRNA (guanosine(2251)-2'-O)-methyltransferase RlmB [Candidatus Binatia bacterium]